ncbi:LOW QUALITY PROTEIN: hypothetical protein PHMEG_00041902, partial [Phytophthora megakarya]
NLDVRKIQRDEDGLAAILGAGITPREHLDEVAEELIPAKGRAKPPPIKSVEMLEDTFQGIVLSFDGAAKTSTWQAVGVLWELPGWKILDAQGFILGDVTVNDAEYCGLRNGLTMAQARGVRDLIAVGDSRIVIQQRVSKIQEKLMKSAEGRLVTCHSGFVITQDEEGCSDNSGCPSTLDVMAAPLPSSAKILVAVTQASVRNQ